MFFQLKTAGPKLVPFLKAVCVYFVAWLPEHEKPTLFAAMLKCLPVGCLCFFVALQGISLEKQHDYNRRILLGLIFSMIGDIFLVWNHLYFIHGMLAFFMAHVLYVRALGFYPLKPLTGAVCFMIAPFIFYGYLPGLKGVLIYAVPGYIGVITIMLWRALSGIRLTGVPNRWTKMCACFGAVLFCISDTIIGINKFCIPVPWARALIMVTYYAGQLGIAVSAFNIEDEFNLRLKNENEKQYLQWQKYMDAHRHLACNDKSVVNGESSHAKSDNSVIRTSLSG